MNELFNKIEENNKILTKILLTLSKLDFLICDSNFNTLC